MSMYRIQFEDTADNGLPTANVIYLCAENAQQAVDKSGHANWIINVRVLDKNGRTSVCTDWS